MVSFPILILRETRDFRIVANNVIGRSGKTVIVPQTRSENLRITIA